MKLKIKLLAMFIALIVAKGKCQTTDGDRDKIHKLLFSAIKKSQSDFTLLKTTRRTILKNFDFAHGGKTLSDDQKLPSNSKEWIEFIKGIDTSKVTDYNLNISRDKKSTTEVMFSPVMFSQDGKKALCLSRTFDTKGIIGSEMAWYFKKNEEKWEIVEVYTHVFID